MPKELAGIYEQLERDIIWLHGKWNIYRQLFGTDPGRIEMLNECAPGFFRVCQDAFLHDVVLELSQLSDPAENFQQENLSLPALLKYIQSLNDPEFQATIQKHLDEVKAHCAPFRKWRHKRLAHRDLRVALKDTSDPLPGISRQKIEEVLRCIRELMNMVRLKFGEAPMAFEFMDIDDGADSLLSDLRCAQAYRSHQIAGRVNPVEDGVVSLRRDLRLPGSC
jgi:hypothetical protein